MHVDRSNADSVQFANWLLDFGHGRGLPLDHSFTIPAHMKLEPATLPALPNLQDGSILLPGEVYPLCKECQG